MFDFLSIGKSLKDFAGELQSTRSEIENVTRQVEDITYAPASKEDVLAALEIWAADNAKKYQLHFHSLIGGLRGDPRILVDKVAVWRVLSAREVLPQPSFHTPMSRDVQLCGLLGVAGFVSLMTAQLDAMDWAASGLPVAGREAAIQPLNQRIKKLKAREAELLCAAAKAGLAVS